MLDFLIRACTHPQDYMGVLRWQYVTLKRTERHENNVYSFIFEKPEKPSWKAGQHGVFWFLGKNMKGGNWRAFSIASSATEHEIRIATIISEKPSAFKQKLQSLQVGEKILMQGPFGEFHLHEKQRVVGIAGGIGITPFRAMVHEMPQRANLTLIYASENAYTFKDELERQKTRSIEILYVRTPQEVNAALENQINVYGNAAHYFISGSPGMIGALKKVCKTKGMKKIVNDPFRGY